MRMISSFHASKCDEYSSITRTHNVLPRHRVRQPHVRTPHPGPRGARPPRLPAPATPRGGVAIVRLLPETLKDGREGRGTSCGAEASLQAEEAAEGRREGGLRERRGRRGARGGRGAEGKRI